MTTVIQIENFLKTHYESQVVSFLIEHMPEESISDGSCFLLDDVSRLKEIQKAKLYNLIVSSPLLNDLGDINVGLLKIHNTLKSGGIFFGRVETLSHRKNRIASCRNSFFYRIIVIYEFVFKRTLPKLFGFRYFFRTSGIMRHCILSKCEALGRLRYCGFEISELKETDKYLYFIAFKDSQPQKEQPHDGILIKIHKIGEGGRTIYCYKLRTMHVYANYLHDYILNNHQVDNEGKVVDDFRMTGWGKFLRKTWLDEMPQLFNILKGDLSFVGLRPLSREFLSLYPEDWRKERIKIKPGFVPPYYADCPKTFKEIIESEKRYCELRKKNPVKTDFIYFFRVVRNVILGRTRMG